MKYFTSHRHLGDHLRLISLDTEYSEEDIKKAELLSVSIGMSPDVAVILNPKDNEDMQKLQEILDSVTMIFTQNGAVDYWMLQRHGITVNYRKFTDCMLMEHLIDETLGHSLGEMALRYFNDNYKDTFWRQYPRYQDAPIEEAMEYEMRDACYTFRLGMEFYERIPDKGLIEHVHRLYWSLFWTEVRGLKVDLDLMERTKSTMKSEIDSFIPQLRKEFYDYINIWELRKWAEECSKRKTDKGKSMVRRPEFNFASGDQLRWLIYDSMECPVHEKTKTGSPKTDFETIDRLSREYPGLVTLAKYKETKAIYSTFVEGMLERVVNGRIYPYFNVNGTRNAGRISHSNPNMGNMPKTGVIRNFFLPDDGNRIIGADYAQLEVVIEANLTEDKQLLKIILEGASKHDITADGLGISRDQAKTLNFALQYGAGVHKVAKILGLSNSSAQEVFDRYWELYSGVKALKNRVAADIERDGFVATPFGRRRHFPKPENEFEKAKFERQGYNALIQGTGADCTNRATSHISEEFQAAGIGRLWFSVHDEIVCDVDKENTDLGISLIVDHMEEPSDFLRLKYPLTAKPYGPLERWAKV